MSTQQYSKRIVRLVRTYNTLRNGLFWSIADKTVEDYFDSIKTTYFESLDRRLASLCLRYLDEATRKPADDDKLLVHDLVEGTVFLKYCRNNWHHHASSCQDQLSNLVLEIFRNKKAILLYFDSKNFNSREGPLEGANLFHVLTYVGLQQILICALEQGGNSSFAG